MMSPKQKDKDSKEEPKPGESPRVLARASAALVSITLVASLVFITGIIRGSGNWYDRQPVFLAQTSAFLRGDFALSRNPADLRVDMVWHNGGVEQVWGLGVPLLLLPWQMGALAAGFSAFPDRVVLALSIALAAALVLLSFESFFRRRGWGSLAAFFLACVPTALFVFFPPFVSLLKSRLIVYEEVEAFLVVWSVLTYGLVFQYLLKKGERSESWLFCAAAFCGGFLPVIRPTGIFSAVPVGLILLLVALRRRMPARRIALGAALFLSGIMFLLGTNTVRFGSPLEFGHRLNLADDQLSLVQTRFETSYSQSPFFGKLVETASAVFLGTNYDSGLTAFAHQGSLLLFQDSAVRWRVFYFRVFDFSFILIVLASLGAAWQARRARPRRIAVLGAIVSGWAMLFGLLCFYSVSPSICSRYLLDFAPAFLVLVGCIFSESVSVFEMPAARGEKARLRKSEKRIRTVRAVAVGAVFAGWFAFEWIKGPFSMKLLPAWYPVKNNYNEAADLYDKAIVPQMPDSYKAGSKDADGNLPFNEVGWNHLTGEVREVAIFYIIASPKPIALSIAAHGFRSEADTLAYIHTIEAKIGTETLSLRSVSKSSALRFLVEFDPPRIAGNQSGLQNIFLRFPHLFTNRSRNPKVLLDSLAY